MIEINLLKEQRRDLIKQHGLARRRDKISYMVLAIGVSGFLVLQLGRLGLMAMQNATDKKVKNLETTLRGLRDVEEELKVVSERAGEVEKVLNTRGPLKEKLAVVAAIFDRNTQLTRIGFGGVTQGGILSVGGSSASIFDLVDFTDRLEKLAVEQGFKSVKQTSLSREETSEYDFSYDLEIVGSQQAGATKKP